MEISSCADATAISTMAQSDQASNSSQNAQDNRVVTSYLLWLLMFAGCSGAHRIYNGKIATGILWFCTWGLFGIGQLIDLALIPGMVQERQLRLMAQSGAFNPSLGTGQATAVQPVTLSREQQMVRLLQVARAEGGRLTVPQAVMGTQQSFAEVEDLLLEMHRKGYVSMDNDPKTGVLIYEFVGL